MPADPTSSLVEASDTVLIHAPLDRVWELSTRVELVREILGMKLVDGVTQGFIEGGSRVVWRGWKFGLPTWHHTLITGFAPPHAASDVSRAERQAWFQDTQERGRFASFVHDHHFRESRGDRGDAVTILEDRVRFSLPWRFGNGFTARWCMRPYVQSLLRKRFARIRELAEGDGWQQWV